MMGHIENNQLIRYDLAYHIESDQLDFAPPYLYIPVSRELQNLPKSRFFDPCKINQFLIKINANLIVAY
jgi:hypothetical protein